MRSPSEKRQLMRAILAYMKEHEGTETITMPVLAMAMPVPENRLHGRQHYISQAIQTLREKGFLQDVEERCPHCKRAKRTHKLVPLYLTDKGRTVCP